MIYARVCCLCPLACILLFIPWFTIFTSFWPALKCLRCSVLPWTLGRWLNSNSKTELPRLRLILWTHVVWPSDHRETPDEPQASNLRSSKGWASHPLFRFLKKLILHPFYDPLRRGCFSVWDVAFSHEFVCRHSVHTMKVSSLCEWQDRQRKEEGRKERKGEGALWAHLHFKRGAREVLRACRA